MVEQCVNSTTLSRNGDKRCEQKKQMSTLQSCEAFYEVSLYWRTLSGSLGAHHAMYIPIVALFTNEMCLMQTRGSTNRK